MTKNVMSTTINEALSIDRTRQVIRLLLGLILGLAVTAGLFWMMQYLIESADGELNEDTAGALLDFVRLKRDESIERRQLKPKKPPPPEAPPPQPPTPQLDDLNPNAEKIAISAVPTQTDVEMSGGFSLGVGEGDYLPIVKVAPIYPQRALSRGIEGYCVVQYTVTRQGTVKDPFVVEDMCTSSLFHRASVQAALKFKYKPRIIDGQAVEVPGVQNQFTFEIEE
ncbi:MAG: energy transducer TonB [Xanthomonadales bacterium]|nr:energy transducer TonB [Xanthomonadales bacterium]